MAPSSDTLTLRLIRHGQTEWNQTRRFLGRTDIPLDEVGREQARRLAAASGAFDAVYTSPLSRAAETARALSLRSGAGVQLLPGLAELDMGELEGCPAAEAMTRWPEVIGVWLQDPAAAVLPGGERVEALQSRVRAAFDEVVARHRPGARVALVTHQLALSALLCSLRGDPLRAIRRLGHRNTAWTEVYVGDRGLELGELDQAPHL